MNLLLLEPEELGPDGIVELSGPRARHLLEVLKVSVGSAVRTGAVNGAVGTGRVEQIEGTHVRLAVQLGSTPPPRPPVDLLMALPRPKVLARLWSQLAALGVGTVVLTNANRVERYYFDSHAVRQEEIRPRLLEGLSQARDTRLPTVRIAKQLKPFVEDELDATFGDARRLLADPLYRRSVIDVVRTRRGRLPVNRIRRVSERDGAESSSGPMTRCPSIVDDGRTAGGTRPAGETSTEIREQAGRIVLALGPEGGWSSYERDLFERNGFVGVGLGARTLRSDTAALALVALTHEALRA